MSFDILQKERQEASAYKCEECGKGFQWKRDLAQHHRLHTGEKLLICSVCGKKFVTRQALLHHVVVHTGEKPFQCCLCGNRFTQPANLRTHTKKKHGDGPIQGCRCPHCGETYPSIVAIHQHILEDHQNIVAEEREVQDMERMQKQKEKEERERAKEMARQKREERKKERIDFNDFRSKGLKEWEINYEFHLGDEMKKGVDWDRAPTNGELECQECNQTFGYRYEIMFHRLCHLTDEEGHAKNKICPECDTVFKVPIGLKHHLILHTGELPFLCLHCWRSFSAHIDLKLHIRREHLFHLNVPQPTKPAKRKSIKDESEVKRKAKKEELVRHEQSRAVIIQNGQEQEPQHITVNVGENGQIINAHELGENVQFVQTENGQIIATSGGESGAAQVVNTPSRVEGEQQTILIGADGQIINPGNQDMIVIINQSEDYEANQAGPIIVDPGQLQQMVGNSSDGSVPQIAIAQGADGQYMIIQQEEGSQEPASITQAPTVTSQTVTQVTQAAASTEQQMIISQVTGNAATEESAVQEGTQYISFQVNEDGTAVPTTDRPEGEQVVMVNAANGQQLANINGKNYVIVEEGSEQNGTSSAATTVVTMTPDDQVAQTNDSNTTVSEEQQRQNQEALNAMVQLATSNTTSDSEVMSPTKEIRMVVQATPENDTALVGQIVEPHENNVQNNVESTELKTTSLEASENMPTTDAELNESAPAQELKDSKTVTSIVVTAETKEN